MSELEAWSSRANERADAGTGEGAPARAGVAGPTDAPARTGGRTPDGAFGLVALVGAGPGRADLVTVRGLDLLERADVVVHDRLDTQELLARAGARNPAGPARLVNVGKREGSHPVPQEQINRILVSEAGRARLVVRLKGGDPYVFGRGGEEASALAAARVPFEVVPGVTSALAAASYAGVPVTDRRHAASFHVLTGHRRGDGELGIDYGALVRAGGTWVFLMAVRTLDQVAEGLLAAGARAETPACVVERGTLPSQRRIDGTLATIAERAHEARVESPAVLVVGEVCARAPELDWYGRLPLRGRTVAVTRPRDRAPELAGRLRALGAVVLELPLIETRPRPVEALVPLAHDLGRFSWLALTSVEGVRCLHAALEAAELDARALTGVLVAAVGPATAAELSRMGIRADLVPATYDTEHLARALAERVAPGERVLLFRSAQGSEALPRVLAERGVPFEDVAAYDTVTCEEEAARLAGLVCSGDVDAVTLTSPSCARALGRALGEEPWPASCAAVCLGAATGAAARAAGMRAVEAAEATVSSLVDAVLASMPPSP